MTMEKKAGKKKSKKKKQDCERYLAHQQRRVFCPNIYSLVFSPFWRELLVGLGRKHLGPTIYFPSSLPNQTHSKKVFLPIFFLKFSIHPVSPLNRYTLRGLLHILKENFHLISYFTQFPCKREKRVKILVWGRGNCRNREMEK